MNTRYALLSVSDKSGITTIAQALHKLGYQIVSTGGTAKTLEKDGVPVTPIEKITGNPESFDGRVKTISFAIEGGILYDRTNKAHRAEATRLKVPAIDIVVCNLYPFEQKNSIENIDVGGPTMIRAAAKNHKNVLVVTSPDYYQELINRLENNDITMEFRRELAGRAFGHLSFYDSQIARYLRHEDFPKEYTLAGRRTHILRYGENPHQAQSAVYMEPGTNSPLGTLKHLVGRQLSYVNFTDIAAGLEAVRLFDEPAACVIKHNSPCGVALGETVKQALERAIEADPVSAFGGAVVINKPLDAQSARVIASFKKNRLGLIDIVAAPSVQEDALPLLAAVRKTTGVYSFGDIPKTRSNPIHARFVDGGYVLQRWDDDVDGGFKDWKVVTKRAPTDKQLKQMQLAWKFITRIRSNAVIVVDAKLPMTRGIGTGQTSRVGSCEIALRQAGKHARGAILASDSFFPFDDCVKLAAKYKIGAIVEQGQSLRDEDSIKAADSAGIPMIFTHRRAFSH